MDIRLADRLSRASDADVEKVIVTLKPGAKRGLLRALQAQGVRVSHDFGLIEAFAGELPVGLLRALDRHSDVVALSSDADVVATGLSTLAIGIGQNSPYSLRATLGLDASSIAVGSTTTAQARTASLTWSHTVAYGNNRLLLVRTANRDGTKSVTAVTYGGAALTKIAEQNAPGNVNKATMWYRLNPTVGTDYRTDAARRPVPST